MTEKVNKALLEIKPQIQAHGGDVEIVKIKNGQLTLKILGACLGCPGAAMTFGSGMEELIRSKVPEVKKVKFMI